MKGVRGNKGLGLPQENFLGPHLLECRKTIYFDYRNLYGEGETNSSSWLHWIFQTRTRKGKAPPTSPIGCPMLVRQHQDERSLTPDISAVGYIERTEDSVTTLQTLKQENVALRVIIDIKQWYLWEVPAIGSCINRALVVSRNGRRG